MTKTEAIKLLDKSATTLLVVSRALVADDIEVAKRFFTQALQVLDNTCAIQLDTLT